MLDAALFASVAVIIVITYMRREERAARQKRIETDFSGHLAKPPFLSGPSLECFARCFGFTLREAETFRYMYDGKTASAIAIKLGENEKTVQSHINSMLSKTGAKTPPEMVALFRRTALQALIRQDIKRAITG